MIDTVNLALGIVLINLLMYVVHNILQYKNFKGYDYIPDWQQFLLLLLINIVLYFIYIFLGGDLLLPFAIVGLIMSITILMILIITFDFRMFNTKETIILFFVILTLFLGGIKCFEYILVAGIINTLESDYERNNEGVNFGTKITQKSEELPHTDNDDEIKIILEHLKITRKVGNTTYILVEVYDLPITWSDYQHHIVSVLQKEGVEI